MLTADHVALAGGIFALLAGVLAIVKEARDARHLKAEIELLKAQLADCRNGTLAARVDPLEIVRPTANDIRRFGAGGIALVLLGAGLMAVAGPALRAKRVDDAPRTSAEYERALQDLADRNAELVAKSLALKERHERLTREYEEQKELVAELQKKVQKRGLPAVPVKPPPAESLPRSE